MWPGERFAKLPACILVTSGLVGISSAQNETTTAGTLPSSNFADGTISKAVITIAILGGAIIICFLVAKLLEHCYSKRSIRDDDSDMSDYTRELLKAQMLLAFSDPSSLGKQVSAERAARYYGNIWRSKVARNNARRFKIQKDLKREEEKKKAEANGTVQNKNKGKKVPGKAVAATKPKPALKSRTSTLSDKKVTTKSDAKPKQVYRTTPMSAKARPGERGQTVKETPEQTQIATKPGETAVQNNNKAENSDNTIGNNKKKDANLKNETAKDNTKQTTSIMICRSNSDDLQIPIKVSTDEAAKPKRGVTFKRENTASSTSEYEFLSSRDKDEPNSDPNSSVASPKSVSGVVLESKDEPASNNKDVKTVQVKNKLKKPVISSGPQATGNRKAPASKPK